MTKRIFWSIFLVALVVLLAVGGLMIGALYGYFDQVQHRQLRNQTALMAQVLEHEGAACFEGLRLTDSRITWIDDDGTVLYDSRLDEDAMENHLEREEIQEALQTGLGESTRYSQSFMEQALYCACRLEDGTVLRLSSSNSTVVLLVVEMLPPVCVILLCATVLSFLMASRLSHGVVRPLNELDLDDPMSQKGYDELLPLLRRIHSQQLQLRTQHRELQQQRDEFQTVTGKMQEGLVLINRKGTILSINNAATRLLSPENSCVGKDILTVNRSLELRELVTRAIQGERSDIVLTLQEGAYQVEGSPVESNGIITGVVLLLLDVTQKKQAELMRREFTANVSHELKTPLHSISGYAELLAGGLVRPEDVPGFSEKIYTEAKRMIRLVEDIIRLSRLDEGSGTMSWEPVDLLEEARQVMDTLGPMAEQAGIRLTLEGQPVVFPGVRQLIHTVIANLCSNAIKYNRPGGGVWVHVHREQSRGTLEVRDTGIGISPEHQERIFERFYCVDKSRSRAVGGTGLGLSIVKHAAAVHKAKVTLESVPEQGTTVRVSFPLE